MDLSKIKAVIADNDVFKGIDIRKALEFNLHAILVRGPRVSPQQPVPYRVQVRLERQPGLKQQAAPSESADGGTLPTDGDRIVLTGTVRCSYP